MDTEDTGTDNEGEPPETPEFDIHHPHDHFVRRWLGDPELAAGFFRATLPEELASWTGDPGRLVLEDPGFIDANLKGTRSDLLWRCESPDGASGYIYVLFEHQRNPHAAMPLRLYLAIAAIWEKAVRESGAPATAPLPFVFPLVLYQGDAEWTAPRRLADLVGIPHENLLPHFPDFGFRLVSLKELDLDHIGPEKLRYGLMAMSLAIKFEKETWWKILRAHFAAGADRDGYLFILRYVFSIVPATERTAMIEEVKQRRPEDAEKFVSLYESLLMEGRQEGREEGRREEKRETARNMAERGFPADQIADVLGIATAELHELLGK